MSAFCTTDFVSGFSGFQSGFVAAQFFWRARAGASRARPGARTGILTKPPPQHLHVTSSNACSACVVAGNPLREAKNPYEDKAADEKLTRFSRQKNTLRRQFRVGENRRKWKNADISFANGNRHTHAAAAAAAARCCASQ